MRKVVLRMNELFKFEVIKKLINSNSNKKILLLNLIVRLVLLIV